MKRPLHHFSVVLFAIVLLVLAKACTSDNKTEQSASSDPEVPTNTRFELVPPSESGIVFSNNVQEDWSNNILTNSYLYNGGGVAIFDANGDGLQDVYLTATTQANRLFINRGNLKFEDITNFAGVGAPLGVKTGVSIVDINGDGALDIYVTRTGLQATPERRNLLFVNDGKANFKEQASQYGLADQSASNHANFFDFDNDGDLDVYILNHPVEFKRVNSVQATPIDGGYKRNTAPRTPYDSDRLMENKGGKFVDVTEAKGLLNNAWGLSVTASDINGDGYTDLYIANDYIEPDKLLFGSAKGTFSDATDTWLAHMSNHTMGVDIADLNADAKPDIVSLDMLAPELDRGKRLMTTMVQERTNSLQRYGYKNQQMRNAVQMNTGARFSDRAEVLGLGATDWSWAPLIADYNLDGRQDLFVTNGYRRDVSNLDYLTSTVDSVKRTGGLTQSRFGTFEAYAKLIPTSKLPNYVFAQAADGSFENVSRAWGLDQPSYSTGAAYADLDNDGDLDLIVNDVDGPATFYRNTTRDKGEGNFLKVLLTGAAPNTEAIGAKLIVVQGDFRAATELRRTRGFFGAVSPELIFGLPNSGNIDSLIVDFATGERTILTNLAANENVEVAIADAKGGKANNSISKVANAASIASQLGLSFTHVENEFEDFGREPLLPTRLSRTGPALAQGDFNSDGRVDLFVGGAAGQASALYVQDAKGKFKSVSQGAFAADARMEAVAAVFFDADGDGDLDLYAVAGGYAAGKGSSSYTDKLYINESGVLAKAVNVRSIGAPGSCVVPVDMDGDGDLDLFVGGRVIPGAYPTPVKSLFLVNNGGTFTALGEGELADLASSLGIVTAATLADLDGDKVQELVIVGEWMPTRVLAKAGNGYRDATADYKLPATGWYNSIYASDLDGDGADDLLFGNLGLNTRYSTPLHLYAGDFDQNGQIDPVFAEERIGKIYPLEKRDPLIKQLPFLKKKFGRYSDYATATIEDVLGEQAITQAKHLVISELSSQLWLSKSQRSVPLGMEAQLAPIYAAARSGSQLITAGNDPFASAETGSIDASDGALVSQDGKAARARQTLSGPVRNMLVLSLATGQQILIVARTGEALAAYSLD